MLPFSLALAEISRAGLVVVALFGTSCRASDELENLSRANQSALFLHCHERGFKLPSPFGELGCQLHCDTAHASKIHSTDTQLALNSRLNAVTKLHSTCIQLQSICKQLQSSCKQLQSNDWTVKENHGLLRKGGASASSLSREKI